MFSCSGAIGKAAVVENGVRTKAHYFMNTTLGCECTLSDPVCLIDSTMAMVRDEKKFSIDLS